MGKRMKLGRWCGGQGPAVGQLLTFRIFWSLRFTLSLYCFSFSQGSKGLSWLSTKFFQQSVNSEMKGESQSGQGAEEKHVSPAGSGSPPSFPLPSLSLPGSVLYGCYPALALSWATIFPVQAPSLPQGLFPLGTANPPVS